MFVWWQAGVRSAWLLGFVNNAFPIRCFSLQLCVFCYIKKKTSFKYSVAFVEFNQNLWELLATPFPFSINLGFLFRTISYPPLHPSESCTHLRALSRPGNISKYIRIWKHPDTFLCKSRCIFGRLFPQSSHSHVPKLEFSVRLLKNEVSRLSHVSTYLPEHEQLHAISLCNVNRRPTTKIIISPYSDHVVFVTHGKCCTKASDTDLQRYLYGQ